MNLDTHSVYKSLGLGSTHLLRYQRCEAKHKEGGRLQWWGYFNVVVVSSPCILRLECRQLLIR